jgi:dUTP pyrophosphatase
MNIEIQYTSPEARLRYETTPLYGTDFSAGIDLRAAIDHAMTILPSEQVFVPTGLRINLTGSFERCAGMAIPRSGRGSRDGLVLGNIVGLIDQDYHGEIMLCCWARPTDGHINASTYRVGGAPVRIEPWERIAQLVIVPVIRVTPVVVDQFSNATERGAGGFGSTGK